ncbi:unnamed protein product [Caenorhabditis bovis]|uniref:VWA domain-containing protein n=1 Tax=Caenorhabditis bovis TaxID=2654633 RepID=A0A8S1EI80_9PELO|nr:unnamed protein product [Caenorhabditis bovis]
MSLPMSRGCYCGSLFTGANCETSVCLNGGTVFDDGSSCICETGYSGRHCEHVACTTQSSDTFEEAQSAIAFVIRASPSMKVQLDEITEAANNIVQYYHEKYPIFLQSYVLTVVANNEIKFVHEYDSGSNFVDSIRSIVTPSTESECDESLMEAISKTLDTNSFKKYPNSPVFVFSDGTANDDLTTMGYLMEQVSNTRSQIFFMMTDSASGKCNIDVSSNSYDQIRLISQLSRGLLVQPQLMQLGEATFALAQDLWQLDSLLVNDLTDCRKAPQFQPFFIDQSIDIVMLQATGISANLSPILTLPNKTQITPPVSYFNNDVYVWRLENPPVGAYFLNINTNTTHSSVCQYRLMGRSTYRLYASLSSDINVDNIYNAPIYQQPAHLVARMDSLLLDDPLESTNEAVVWYNDPSTSERILLFASSGMWRDSCQYELYFGKFVCPQAYLPIYINIYTTDAYDQVVVRTATSYCSTTEPTPTDNCLNGGVFYNKTCQCSAHFTGDRCQRIVCEHSGNALFGVCQCPAGYSGQFCEIVQCHEYNGYGFWGFNHRSLTVMVHDSLTTRATMRTLNDASARVINDILYQHPKWISNYQLVTFNDSVHSLLVDTEKGDEFVRAVTDMYNANKQHSGYSCLNLDFYATLLETISHVNVQWGGIVYVFLYGQPKKDQASYAKILQRIEVNKIQINVVQSSLNPCGQDITIDGLISLTQFSGGSFITATSGNAGNVFNTVPTNYMSNLVYEDAADDCTNATFYFPIDDGTQSFTSYLQGYFDTEPVYKAPDGTTINPENSFNDYATNSRMDHIIRECDDGWALQDSHCYYFSSEPLSWSDARAACHAEGAALSSIFNSNEQSFLDASSQGVQFWIGLNDMETLGTYKWDTIEASLNLSLDDTKFTNWQNGQPDNQEGKRCVLDSNRRGEYGWITEPCDKPHYYSCMKHTYSVDYEPTDVGINHLSRGVWQVQIKGKGSCSIAIRSQSSVQVATRFTSNIHDDVGREEPNKNTDTNRLIVYANGIKNHRAVEYVHFYYDDMSIIDAEEISYRGNCLFSYYSTPFKCPNFFYQMLITGVDDSGFLYQRIVPAACIGGIDKDSCTNDGVFHKGSCLCTPNFYGETCQYAYSQNGGFLSASLGKCSCPDDFEGQFCEIPICTRNQLNVPEIADSARTFVVAIDGASNGLMKDVLDNIEKTLVDVLSTIDRQDPHWFTTFVGVVFRDVEASRAQPPVKPVSEVFSTDNYTTFASLIADEIKKNPYKATQEKRNVFTGLVKALTHSKVVPNSKVFVITTGNAEDTVDRQTVLSALAMSHSSVHFMFIGDTKPPGDATTYDDPTVRSMFEAAHISGGTTYQLASPNDLENTWELVLSSLHHSYFILTHQLNSCSNYMDYIQLDANGSEIVVDVFSQSASQIMVYDADKKAVDTFTLVSSKTNQAAIFKKQGDGPGIWTVDVDYNLAHSGPCTINIRTTSDLEIDLGFTQDVASDDGLHDGSAVLFPRAGDFSNAIVVDVDANVVLTYSQIYDLNENRLIWASPLIKRSACAYQYISQKTFKCVKNAFVVAIDGLDYEGHPFRRTYTIHCDGDIPPRPTDVPTEAPDTSTSQQPATTLEQCDPATNNIDLIIAFDSSSGITNEMFYATVGAFKDIGNEIVIGADKSRILLGTYDDVQHFRGNMSTIDGISAYEEEVLNLYSFGYTGVDGNNVQSIFDYINTEIVPLRAEPVRKLLIFISSQGWDKGNAINGIEQGYQDPSPTAKKLHDSGLEMLAIGMGPNANMTQLGQIAKCTLQSSQLDTLTKMTYEEIFDRNEKDGQLARESYENSVSERSSNIKEGHNPLNNASADRRRKNDRLSNNDELQLSDEEKLEVEGIVDESIEVLRAVMVGDSEDLANDIIEELDESEILQDDFENYDYGEREAFMLDLEWHRGIVDEILELDIGWIWHELQRPYVYDDSDDDEQPLPHEYLGHPRYLEHNARNPHEGEGQERDEEETDTSDDELEDDLEDEDEEEMTKEDKEEREETDDEEDRDSSVEEEEKEGVKPDDHDTSSGNTSRKNTNSERWTEDFEHDSSRSIKRKNSDDVDGGDAKRGKFA